MLHPWKTIFQVPFDANSPTPLYLQVEKYVISEIKAGRFPEYMMLPSYRKIALENRVSETTIRTAFRRLRERKWLRSEPRKGNFICYREEFREEIEKVRLRRLKYAKFEWQYRFNESMPEPQPVEVKKFTRLFKKALLQQEENPGVTAKVPPPWSVYDDLELTAVELLNQQYNFHLSPRNLCLIPGHQHLLNKIALRLLSGQMVIVTCPGDPVIKKVLTEVNVLPVPLQVHPSGIDLIQLEALFKTHRVKAILIDSGSYTLMAGAMSEQVMDTIILLAEKYHFLIIEHNSDRELWFGPGPYPLITGRRHRDRVIYLSCLSNLITPLNYFGIVAGPEHFIDAFKEKWLQTSLAESREIARTVHQLLVTGEARRATDRRRKYFTEKRKRVSLLIRDYLDDHITFTMPPAGLGCWLYLKDPSKMGFLLTALQKERILLRPQADYSTGYPTYSALFFGFAREPLLKIEQALCILKSLFEK